MSFRRYCQRLFSFFEIPSGFLSDAIGYRQTILLSFLLNFAARVLMLLSQNFWMFAAEAVVEAWRLR